MTNKKTISRDIVEFCQIMQVAMNESMPLPSALQAYSKGEVSAQVSKWAQTIANLMAQGHSLEKSTSSIKEIDPVLAKILPFALKNNMVGILQRYVRFVTALEIMAEKTKALAFYPFIISMLVFLSLLQLNFSLFPVVFDMFMADGIEPNFLYKLLYFAEPKLWPISLFVPLLILIFVAMAFRFSFGKNNGFRVFNKKYSVLSKVLERQEISRLQNIIALFLRAGHSLENSIEMASELASQPYKDELKNICNSLSRGHEIDFSFGLSRVLRYVSGEDVSTDEIAARLERSSEQNNRSTKFYLGFFNKFMELLLLLAVALLVALIVSGSFGTCQWLIWSL